MGLAVPVRERPSILSGDLLTPTSGLAARRNLHSASQGEERIVPFASTSTTQRRASSVAGRSPHGMTDPSNFRALSSNRNCHTFYKYLKLFLKAEDGLHGPPLEGRYLLPLSE